jgi:dienelactone hydrolase
MAGDFRGMSNDVKGAVDYLSFYRYINHNIYLVGSSVGSTVAINYAAQDSGVQRVVMLSPGQDYQGVETSTALSKVAKQVYFVAANGDSQSAEDARTAYGESKAPKKELLIYTDIGAAHGTDMLAASASSTQGPLAQKIADWLK